MFIRSTSFKGAEASSAVSALGRDSSLEDAKQILLEAQASITESLEKLHSAAQEEHILGQIEDSLRTTLRLIDHLDETCFPNQQIATPWQDYFLNLFKSVQQSLTSILLLVVLLFLHV